MESDQAAKRGDISVLAARVIKAADPQSRYFVGIVGPPGSGKSTLAQTLSQTINQRLQKGVSIVVPMDGFHLPNSIVRPQGLHPLKGIPQTFDAAAFVNLLRRLHAVPSQTVTAPAFERRIDDPVDDAITVTPAHRIIIVEGNYLLLDSEPWNEIPPLLNEAWYIAVDRDVMHQRLINRHIAGGRSRAQAEAKILSTDLPNAELIEQTQHRANLIIGAANSPNG